MAEYYCNKIWWKIRNLFISDVNYQQNMDDFYAKDSDAYVFDLPL